MFEVFPSFAVLIGSFISCHHQVLVNSRSHGNAATSTLPPTRQLAQNMHARAHAQKTPDRNGCLCFSGATQCKFTGGTRAAKSSLGSGKFTILLRATGCQRERKKQSEKSPVSSTQTLQICGLSGGEEELRGCALNMAAATMWARLRRRRLRAINPDNRGPHVLDKNITLPFGPSDPFLAAAPVKVSLICFLFAAVENAARRCKDNLGTTAVSVCQTG